ncbi:MAG: hypothetical protein NTZ24_10420 [Deltaproteobacteria bacterium]|nr:hypothetical protein [Deltaproteobacteria bacterium]
MKIKGKNNISMIMIKFQGDLTYLYGKRRGIRYFVQEIILEEKVIILLYKSFKTNSGIRKNDCQGA